MTIKHKSKGFTLIELLVVIAIIGLLSTFAVVALNSSRAKSRDAKRLSDIKAIQTGLELYYADNNKYPLLGTEQTLGSASYDCLDEDGITASCDTGGTTYMSQIPANPTPTATALATYKYISTAANFSTACTTAPCKGYKIRFALEGATAGYAGETILYATPGGISATAP